MVADQGKAYGYRVETLARPFRRGCCIAYMRKTGHEELVRGRFSVNWISRAAKRLIAVGNDPLVTPVGGAPTTIISPSLLFDELEAEASGYQQTSCRIIRRRH